MPKKAKELTALAVSKLREDGRYAVGGSEGLHLQIMNGSRSWILRVAVGVRVNRAGKETVHRRDIGLGVYPDISLAVAREKARELRQKIRNGVDPVEVRKAAALQTRIAAERSKSFEECGSLYIAANRAGWKNAKHTCINGMVFWRSSLARCGARLLRGLDEEVDGWIKARIGDRDKS